MSSRVTAIFARMVGWIRMGATDPTSRRRLVTGASAAIRVMDSIENSQNRVSPP
jgi:hypothetical protein